MTDQQHPEAPRDDDPSGAPGGAPDGRDAPAGGQQQSSDVGSPHGQAPSVERPSDAGSPYGQAPSGQAPHGQTPHVGQPSDAGSPYGHAPHAGQPSDAGSPSGQAPYGQAPYAGQPSDAGSPYGQAPYVGQPPAGQAGAPGGPFTPATDRQVGMFAHLLNIVGVLGPLILWLVTRERGPLANSEGKEATNWGITVVLAFAAVNVLGVVVGFILPPLAIFFPLLGTAVFVVNIVFAVLGALHVSNTGRPYRNPLAIRFLT